VVPKRYSSFDDRDKFAVAHVSPIEEKRTGPATPEESELLARLRDGDERAFQSLVETHHGVMIAVAGNYVKTHAVAEEVVQEAWLGVLEGLDRFEGRSSLRTWIMRILVNTALGRGAREARSVPFASMAVGDEREPTVEPQRFRRPGEAFAGHWSRYPTDWSSLPEQRLLGSETLEVAKRGIEALPEAQRVVMTMRDIVGCTAEDVCDVLEISATNQRVLLHRARSKVRAALERHLYD
jgi:RNA polymerase sigma-70 factor (ECF subfamily)